MNVCIESYVYADTHTYIYFFYLRKVLRIQQTNLWTIISEPISVEKVKSSYNFLFGVKPVMRFDFNKNRYRLRNDRTPICCL